MITLAVPGAQAACLTVDPDQPPPALSGDWCLTAAFGPSQQTSFDWPNESLVLRTLTFETLPGQLGNLSLVDRSDGREIWKSTVTGEGVAESRSLLLVPGEYGLTITAGPTPLIYRAEVTQSVALPPELPVSVAGEFEGLLLGTGAEIIIPWNVPEAVEAGLWTVGVQAPIGISMTATLRDSAATSVIYSATADGAGTFRLPDLDLPPGAYSIAIYGPPAGTPLIAKAEFESRPAAFAMEPDDLPEQAHPLAPDIPASGRLATGGSSAEADYFALTVPPGDPQMYDIALSASSTAFLNLALTDDSGRYRASRDGVGTVALNSLVLSAGRHLLKVTGTLPPEATYTLTARETGIPLAGRESEPNNEAVDANPVPASGKISGAFDGADNDYLVLTVAGPLQLWDIEASGEGASALELYDAGQRLIATTTVRAGSVFRLDRMLLPPGRNVVRLAGNGGSWLLRAEPVGDLVDGEEYESNDEAARALVLPFGDPRTGWLQRPDDSDIYAFHLAAWQRVAITVTGPAGIPVHIWLSSGELSNRIANAAGVPVAGGEAGLVWQGLLPPGDYLLDVRSDAGRSREPYTILLQSPSFFDRPLDLEPNDEVWQAATRAPAGNVIEGSLGDGGDWFPLDPLETTGPLVVKADELASSVEIRLAYGDPKAPQVDEVFYLYQSGETGQFNAPVGEPLYLGVRGNAGAYRLSLGPELPQSTLPVEAELTFDAVAVAAFEEVGQLLSGRLIVRSLAETPLRIGTRAWISDERWRLAQLPEIIDVPPSGSIELPLSLEVPAEASDQAPVFVDVALGGDDAAPTPVRAKVEVRTDAPAVGVHAHEPIPASLRGGLNLASAALGANADAIAAGLFDGVIDTTGVVLDVNQPATVTLAGNGEPAPVAGVILQPARGGSPSDRLFHFAVEASTDGATFERVLEATLSPATREQAFAFDEPISAIALRLVPIAAAGGPNVLRLRLAELQAIAIPEFVLDPAGLDIADPALGGHIVWAFGLGEQILTGEAAIWPTSPVYIDFISESVEPPGWVFGFRDGRAAALRTIIWHPRGDVPPAEQIRRVAVAASIAGPLGPWQEVGTFELSEGSNPTQLDLPAGLWARALRFTVRNASSGRLVMPARIEIREAPGPSVLGAWPDLSPSGPYEAGEAQTQVSEPATAISHDPLHPTELPLETLTRGEVRRGIVEDWYAIELPEGTRAVTARFDGGTAPVVALTLVAPNGNETPFEPDPTDETTLIAGAGPGSWRIKVTQPVASVAVTWDTSASVGALVPAIERMVRRLVWELDPNREAINLLPFRDEMDAFLMPEWSGDRSQVFGALFAYPFVDSSSEAESAMAVAAEHLNARVGQRAIVIVTDASFAGWPPKNEQLWRRLSTGQIKVFSLYVPVDYDPARTRAQTNLMSDWANAAGGHISRFASQADSETAYRRVAAWLKRPARYEFEVSSDTSPPPPGLLTVELGTADEAGIDGPAEGPSVAVSVILDASGSMLQRIGGERRIDVAKEVLRELGENILPEGLPVSLRVFGHDAPGSCESELFLPLQPLDRVAFAAAVDRVQSVNRARTSIAASLRATFSDFGTARGSRIVVLITDGEETCGGDPLTEIGRLREEGVDVRLNIVGFAIDDPALRQTFEAWADAGAGAYFDASDSTALGEAVRGATALSYAVLDERGVEVARGLVGEAIELPAGRYSIRLGGQFADVQVVLGPGEIETLVVN